MNERRKTLRCLLVVAVMMFSTTVVHAATVNTFANAETEVKVELRDPGNYLDTVTGQVSLPEGETVTSATVDVQNDFATTSFHRPYDSTVSNEIWDARYNSMLSYSSTGCHQFPISNCDFSTTEENLALTSRGFNADFETSAQGFAPGTPVNSILNWERVQLAMPTSTLPSGCATGITCWGTNFHDPNYTDDSPSSTFEYELMSGAMMVYPGKGQATFKSQHSLYYRASGVNKWYDDCAYVALRTSNDAQSWGQWGFHAFDRGNSTGVSPGQHGMFQRGTLVNQVTAGCSGKGSVIVPTNAWVLAGQSDGGTPGGLQWATLALDLSGYANTYVQLKFVLERNAHTIDPVNDTMPGWFIDTMRAGDPLPQSGHVTIGPFSSMASQSNGFPDGFGVLNIESAIPSGSSFSIDIFDASNNQLVIDINGNTLTGLTGTTIELWDVDASVYSLLSIRFNYNSGSSRMVTPVLYGFNLGTKVGTGLRDLAETPLYMGGSLISGTWDIDPMGGWMWWAPSIMDYSWNPAKSKSRFSMPVVAVKPIVEDDCGNGEVSIIPNNIDSGEFQQVTSGQWYDFNTTANGVPIPSTGVSMYLFYPGECTVTGLWLELEFGHSSESLTIDIAGDHDVEWGLTDPAFGAYGWQRYFRSQVTNGVNMRADTMSISMAVNGKAEGAPFLLPKDAIVTHAEVSFSDSDVGNASINLLAANQEQHLGWTEDELEMTPDDWRALDQFSNELQTLLDDPQVPAADVDEFGNEWVQFRFRFENTNAAVGTSVTMRDLEIFYEWGVTLGAAHDVARELNQGVALGTPFGGEVAVPIRIEGDTGGAVKLKNLLVTTEGGYDNTLNTTGSWSGLYSNGDVYEAITTHSLAAGTGETIAHTSLQFESESGNAEFLWTAANDSFWERGDETMLSLMVMQSSATDVAEGKQMIWRFRVNSDWQDSPTVRVFTTMITASGSEGLPAALMLDPVSGNAAENDAHIQRVDVYNQGGILQPVLSNVSSSQVITLNGSVRFENLDESPDPAAYNLVFELQNQSNFSHWIEVDRLSSIIGGDFEWQPTISQIAAGTDTYRLRMADYSGGDTLCPPSMYNPDSDCAIHIVLNIDTYPPVLVNISVWDMISDWRELADDTWIPPAPNQKFRVVARDFPEAPDALMLYYWVEAQHDDNSNRIPEPNEYRTIDLVPISVDAFGNTTYELDNPACPPNKDCLDDQQTGLSIPDGDTAPRTSMFVVGTDSGGNPINGGAAGFMNDLVTYIGRESRAPGIYSFHVSDAYDNPLTEFNKSMYAGNIYQLLVHGKDDNGWRDLDYVKIDLNPYVSNDMVLWYSPRNSTAWTDSLWVDILNVTTDGVGAKLTKTDGTVLIDAFETEFLLNMPIRLHWSVPTVGGVVEPDVYMRDLDPDNGESILSSSRYKQRWIYSSGLKFDVSSLSLEDTSGFITASIGAQDGGYTRPGDLLLLKGNYLFKDALEGGIDVKPQIPITLVITRTPIYPGGQSSLGYVASSPQTDEYQFENGTFELLISAALATNEYRYVFSLDDIPEGAIDSSPEVDRTFYAKVDDDAPSVIWGSWKMRSGITGDLFEKPPSPPAPSDALPLLPSSSMNCVNIEFTVDELQRLNSDSISINWMFFQDNFNWSSYRTTFPEPWQTRTANIDLTSNKVNMQCVDLWEGHNIPRELNGVEIRFWVTGEDSAGNGVNPVTGGSFGVALEGGAYELTYQQAEFRIDRVDLSTGQPEALSSFDILLQVTNIGTEAGQLSLEVFIVINGSQQGNFTHDCGIIWEPNMQDLCRVPVDPFPQPLNGIVFAIYDSDGNMLGESEQFHVRAAGSSGTGGMDMWVIVGIGGAVAILIALVVVVLMVLGRRREDDDEFFLEDEDYLPPGEAMEPISRGPPPSRSREVAGYEDVGSTPPGYGGGGPPAAGPPRQSLEMQQALAEFSFWDEETIQGYFDQGWSIEQLHDWVRENH